ncbi:MmgE/PrpD family protein [Cupriavidus sp. DF5525]|uniref:MmgE/PrpD family protein n=1 Tax=Cupriavidus sp. DF5525 TaxID=3160989 RepID=UPI0032DEB9CC
MSTTRRRFLQVSALAGTVSAAPARALAASPDRPATSALVGAQNGGQDAIVDLVNFALSTRYEDLSQEVIDFTKMQILDTIGVSYAAINAPGVEQLRAHVREMAGKAESTVWGTNRKVPAQNAALVNGTMSHALDYDDIYEPAYLHAAVITVPAAVTLSEIAPSVTGKELIAGIAAAVDVGCRLALAAQPGKDGLAIGWHNTTLYGYFTTAILASRMLGLTPEQTVYATGISFHQAAGNSQTHLDGALTKRMGPGFASSTGINAARLARLGITGPRHILEGKKGFFVQYHHGDYSRDILLDGLGKKFSVTDTAFKPWPSCRGSHTAVEGALGLRAEHKFAAQDVANVMVYNGPGEYSLLASPIEKKRNPQTVVDAQFSNPWVIATAFVDGEVSLRHFTDRGIQRADIREMAQRINSREDTSLVRKGGGPGATRVEVELRNGKKLSRTVAVAKGEPRNPLSSAEFGQKFLDCMSYGGMKVDAARQLMVMINGLESLGSAADIPRRLGSPGKSL